MNAVEIEEAVSALVEESFDPAEFPFAFLEAFGNKSTTIKRLRKGDTNKSDLAGGLLQRSNIHIKVCELGAVAASREELLKSPATTSQKAKFVLATDGSDIEAENLIEGDTLACSFKDLPDHFGFFLALAGITTVKQIRDNAFDIKATGRMNRLYVELRRENPDWDTNEQKDELNHFFARLIFCFFAEDTGIFPEDNLFTGTIQTMSESDGSNIHEVITEIFRAMNIPVEERDNAGLPRWAATMPFVNGGLFESSTKCPRFTKIARSYLIHIGGLDWTKINPDIFGSMIQAVAEDQERGEIGMHYTSVPNILKVLNPLFLDNLRQQLEDAGDNKRKLLNLRNRMAGIRVFDPACGSGNFLVVAYKEMRAIEAEVNKRRGEIDRVTEIPATNFRGIEIRSFAAEVARLALVIAEFQCDLAIRGPSLALSAALPLTKSNWITCGNALLLDWLDLCPQTNSEVKITAHDPFETSLGQDEVAFENEGGELYICGNPPYKGTKYQTKQQKRELREVVAGRSTRSGSLDYVCGWFIKAAEYSSKFGCDFAFVSTNSICQGTQVPVLWTILFTMGIEIQFAHLSFKWQNLARGNAGVVVIIIGMGPTRSQSKCIYDATMPDAEQAREVNSIGPYLIPNEIVIVEGRTKPLCSNLGVMTLGNQPYDGGYLIFHQDQIDDLDLTQDQRNRWVRPLFGSAEITGSRPRYCLWIKDEDLLEATSVSSLNARFEKVRSFRTSSCRPGTRALASRPHQFAEMHEAASSTLVIPLTNSVRREFLPPVLQGQSCSPTNTAYAIYDPEIWHFGVLSARLFLCWTKTVAGRMKVDPRVSNKMSWHTFSIPTLTEQNKADLTRCAEDILLARESHFPKTIADLYDPDGMPDNLREAHDRNDETLERIYIGRRFKNDTERLEKLFELYAKLTSSTQPGTKRSKQSSRKESRP